MRLDRTNLAISLSMLGLLACPADLGAAAAAAFKVCTSDEWPPYITIENGLIGGSHTEMVRAAFRRLNQPLEIVSLPWARCMADVDSGDQDGAYPASWSPDRATMALYPTVPLGELSYVLATTRVGAASWNPGHQPSLLPQPIAAPHGFSILTALRRLDGVQVVDHLASDEADLVALLRGQVGAIAIETEVARYITRRDGVADEVAILEPPLVTGQKYYLMVSKHYGGGLDAAQFFTNRVAEALRAIETPPDGKR